MAWCRLVTSHYMSQYWPRSTLPYGVTKSQLFHGPESSIITYNFYKVRFIVINGEFTYLLKAEWCKYVQVNKPTSVQIMVYRLLAPSLYLNDNSGKVQSNAKFWFFFKMIHLKMLSGKLAAICLGIKYFTHWGLKNMANILQTTFIVVSS